MSATQRTTSFILLAGLSGILGCAERQARIEDLERKNVQLADDKQLLSTELATVNMSVEQMRRELTAANQTSDKQHEKNAALTAELDNTLNRLKTAAAAPNVQIAELTSQLKTANSESDAARADTAKAVAAANAADKAAEAAKAREQELTRQVAALTKQLEEAGKAIKEANKKTEPPTQW